MDWVTVSLISAVVFAVVSILDKVILTRYTPSAPTFIVLTGLLQIPGAFIVLIFVPFQSYSLDVWIIGYFAGFVWGISLVIMFLVMSREDVSRVIPVIATSPVFVAVLATIYLQEDLSVIHWAAIVVIVAGAALISLRWTDHSQKELLGSSFFLLLLASALVAGGQFLSKVALEEMSVLNLHVLRNVGLGMACMLIPLRPSIIRETRQVLADRKGTGVLVLNEGIIALVASLLTLWSIALGPVSLVVTVMSTRPLFVFVMSVLLSFGVWKMLEEPLDRGTVVRKMVFTAIIVAGVAGITLL